MALHLTLERDVLSNDDDPAGLWQYEGGKVFEHDGHVGFYAVTRRVTVKATDVQNTAMLTMTIFFLPDEPPENITVQGSHDFHSGNEVGSVSAASSGRAIHRGKNFTRVGNTVTIG